MSVACSSSGAIPSASPTLGTVPATVPNTVPPTVLPTLTSAPLPTSTPTTAPSPSATAFVIAALTRTAEPTRTLFNTATAAPPAIQLIYHGIKRPHGLAVAGDTLYVSSETDKGIYAIREGRITRFLPLNFPHDIIVNADDSLITPVFMENRVVKISKEGSITELAKGLAGPNGIARSRAGDIYVSNYRDGSVVKFREEDARLQTVATGLSGPAGLAYDDANRALYVAQYLGNSIVKLTDTGKVNIQPTGLGHFESLSLGANGNLKATAVSRGVGVVVNVRDSGEFAIVITTDLPDPLVAHFADGFMFFESPNDPLGRVFKAKLD